MVLKQNYVLMNHREETATKSGILLSLGSQEKTLVGTIAHVGDDCTVEGLKEGMVCVYDKLNASPIEIEGVNYDIIEDTDIIAIIEG